MLFNFNNNYINLAEIVSMTCTKSGNEKYPYNLNIYLKNGKQYEVMYQSEAIRNKEACNIMQAHNNTVPEPVTQYEVEQIVNNEVEKIRRDFRRLRELIKEEQTNGKQQ